MISRRIFLSTVAAIGLGLNAVGTATAQSYPDKPIKLIVPFPAGGTVDVIARLVGQPLAAKLGQGVVIDNRPGAGTTIALKALATADPDGYTLMVGSTGSLAINPALYKNIDFAPIRTITPVATMVATPLILVVIPAVPAKSVEELVAYAKANPGKLSHGASLGTPPHLVGEFFRARTGVDIIYVPYKGTAPAIIDVLAGQVQVTAETPSILLPLIQQGKVRPIVVTSPTRLPELPDVPTLVECGLAGFPSHAWMGIIAPGGTPVPVVSKLNAAVNEILTSSEMKQSLAKLGFEAKIGTPQDFAALIADETPRWADIVKLSGAKME